MRPRAEPAQRLELKRAHHIECDGRSKSARVEGAARSGDRVIKRKEVILEAETRSESLGELRAERRALAQELRDLVKSTDDVIQGRGKYEEVGGEQISPNRYPEGPKPK